MAPLVSAEMKRPSTAADDFLRGARRLVRIAVLLPLVLVLLMAADGWLRAGRQDQAAGRWMRRLDLSAPAFWPSGTPGRSPEALPPAIDLRMSPVVEAPAANRPMPLFHAGARQP